MKQLFLTFVLFGLFASTAFSQEDDATQAEEQTAEVQTTEDQKTEVQQAPVRRAPVEIAEPTDLPSHYEYLKAKAENYNDYKVIKKTRLDNFWKVVTDSISNLKQEIKNSHEQIASQKTEIESFGATIDEKTAAVEEATFDRTHISFLGIDLTKSAYITINVVLISALIIILILVSLRYQHKRQASASKLKEFDELQNSYEDFKKQSLEKQIKLNRELQTERNTIEELRSKSTITKKITA